ncbi:MAG: Sua5/YciO/YrdC/YwlC family protein [Acidobacteriota bacterium]|nr:Sua5/YciO/YrdC/YwlC family protein [Acidobacteriota bacterium]
MDHDRDRRAKVTLGGNFGPSVDELEQVIKGGGVVLFPSDTVYGLACDPDNAAAIDRLYALKGRAADKAAAVMFFELRAGLRALPELGQRTHEALHRLMPGQVTALLPNLGHRFPLACRADPETLGLRIVSVSQLANLQMPVLQSSANRAGGADARSLEDVEPAIRAGADLVIDGGVLPGTASTVIDLRGFEADGSWSIVREGPVSELLVSLLLSSDYHFEPGTYDADVVDELHDYNNLQARLVEASAGTGPEVTRILELGTGTGATARRLLAAHPRASLVGVDASRAMLAAAAQELPADRFEARLASFGDPLPAGPFGLVASALAVHHLDDAAKADLFRRVREVLAPGGRLVLADLIAPVDPADALIELYEGFDRPSPIAQQLEWLRDAGFAEASVAWERQDLAVIVADA